jgi:hypothetical protein
MSELKHNKLLSQEEVNLLPIGTKVIVTWTGGNGPHKYKIAEHRKDGPVTNIGIKNGHLDFVGKESYHTHVSIVNKEEL